MNSLAVKDVDNEVLADADEYLRKHKICELFEVSPPCLPLRYISTEQPHFCDSLYLNPFPFCLNLRLLTEYTFSRCTGLDNFALLQAAGQRGVILGYPN